ncbi:MAG TPA: S-methyl-5'-thioadenosine phosphorylase [Anaerolineae bacterium]|nr:S-methyl-5'-thioadenosine phosphorylase [Anaerolineae bacterium]
MPKLEQVKLAVIGGSGLYNMEALTDVKEYKLKTPFGDPSDAIVVGTLAGQRVGFLPRHGRGHRILPTEVNSRANIYALKMLGVERILSVSACGSLREDYAPRHIVIPDQLFDRTRGRNLTFFGNGIVAHIGLADPFCAHFSDLVYDAVKQTGAIVHKGATLVTIEGPRFSTKAESNLFRQWGMGIIGMTAIPEANLAREAEMCYCCMAHVTDYDVWHVEEEPVTVAMVIERLLANVEVSKQAIVNLVSTLPAERHCECEHALRDALITDRAVIPDRVKRDLAPIIGQYVPAAPAKKSNAKKTTRKKSGR